MKTNEVKELIIEYNLTTGVAEISPEEVDYAKVIRACLLKRVNPDPGIVRTTKKEIVTINLLYTDNLTVFDVTSDSGSFVIDSGILIHVLHTAKLNESKELKK